MRSGYSHRVCHHFRYGPGRPVEGMRPLVPLGHAWHTLRLQVGLRDTVHEAPLRALEDRAPLCHRVQPRTGHRGAGPDQPRGGRPPRVPWRSLIGPGMVADAMDGGGLHGHRRVQGCPAREALARPLTGVTRPIDPSGAGVEPGTQRERPVASIGVLDLMGPSGPGRTGGVPARTRWHGGLFSPPAAPFVRAPSPSGQGSHVGHAGRERRVTWRVGRAPQVVAPRLEVMVHKEATARLSGHVLDYARACQWHGHGGGGGRAGPKRVRCAVGRPPGGP
jgi:hypothetical protein